MEKPTPRAMAGLRVLTVLNAAFFFFGVRPVREDLQRASMNSLQQAERAHRPYAYATMFSRSPTIFGISYTLKFLWQVGHTNELRSLWRRRMTRPQLLGQR